MREENGVFSLKRLNLNKKDVLKFSYFYLRSNDVVYVETDKAKGTQASTRTKL